jgi:hypothetical protein
VTILGDFTNGGGNGASDASNDGTLDSTIGNEGGPDTVAADTQPAEASGHDAAGDGEGGSTCSGGGMCDPGGVCQAGTETCDAGVLACVPSGTALNGTMCDAGAVCMDGGCVPCMNGGPCTPPGAECHSGTTVCSGASVMCTDTGNPGNEGMSCGTNLVCTGGNCLCKTGYSMCNGTCVDLTSDPAHCGTCTKSCVYGTCAASACQSWAVGYFGGGEFATDGVYVVVDNGIGTVNEYKASGGAVAASPTSNLLMQVASGPVLANGTVAWLGSGISVYTAPEGSSTGTPVASFPSGYTPTYLTINPSGNIAYVIGQSNATGNQVFLFSCTLSAGSTCTKVGSSYIEAPGTAGYQTQYLQVTANQAFWTYGLPPSAWQVGSYNFGTNIQQNVNQSGLPTLLTLDATSVYWIAPPGYSVYRAAQSNVTSPTAITSASSYVYGLASDGTNVYVGTGNSAGAAILSYAPVGGGTLQTLVKSQFTVQSHIGAIHTAGGAVYYADVDDSTCPPNPYLRAIAAP